MQKTAGEPVRSLNCKETKRSQSVALAVIREDCELDMGLKMYHCWKGC